MPPKVPPICVTVATRIAVLRTRPALCSVVVSQLFMNTKVARLAKPISQMRSVNLARPSVKSNRTGKPWRFSSEVMNQASAAIWSCGYMRFSALAIPASKRS